ncbi:hypothetical protein ACRAWD_29230 [Caulobacter segnis]
MTAPSSSACRRSEEPARAARRPRHDRRGRGAVGRHGERLQRSRLATDRRRPRRRACRCGSRAVPEGTIVPTHQALMTIENTDPRCFWLPSYLETLLLRVWYPVTVATISWQVKQTIRAALEKTSDNAAAELPFKLHDFGARGVASRDRRPWAGLAHLVNFQGSDTLSAVLAGRAWYHEPMAAFSIPAAEAQHGDQLGPRENEVEAYRNMLARASASPARCSRWCPTATTCSTRCATCGAGTLRQAVIDSGDPGGAARFRRPGDHRRRDLARLLDETFGSTVNGKSCRS